MRNRIKNYLGRNLKRKRTSDKLSKERRSALMSQIRSRETRFEKEFIALLEENTRFKFKTYYRSIRGTPDIVFEKQKLCVFLDSDFWHGWQYPRWKHQLKNDFWRRKIELNRRRDILVTAYLRRRRWRVARIWEHEIKLNPSGEILKIKQLLKERNK